MRVNLGRTTLLSKTKTPLKWHIVTWLSCRREHSDVGDEESRFSDSSKSTTATKTARYFVQCMTWMHTCVPVHSIEVLSAQAWITTVNSSYAQSVTVHQGEGRSKSSPNTFLTYILSCLQQREHWQSSERRSCQRLRLSRWKPESR